MPIYLRQSTASQEIPLGYFVDSTDGNTAETGLTIANTDIDIWKTGATTLADKNSGGATHIAGGIYYCVLDATDTDTIGPLVVFVKVAGALAVRVECCVLDEVVYDWMFGTATPTTGGAITVTSGRVNADITHIATAAVSTTTAQLGVNVVQISGDGTSADNLESYTDGTTPQPVNVTQVSGDATAADNLEAVLDGTGGVTLVASAFTLTTPITANATQLSGDATAADNAEAFFDGTGYAGTNNVIPTVSTVSALAANSVSASALAADAAAEIADAVWDEDATGHQTQGTFGQTIGDSDADTTSLYAYTLAIESLLDTEVAAIKAKTDNLPSDPADDSDIDTQLASIVTKLDTVDDFLDTEIAAIKAKTDSLTFTVAGVVDANVQRINDVTIVGDGASPKFGV